MIITSVLWEVEYLPLKISRKCGNLVSQLKHLASLMYKLPMDPMIKKLNDRSFHIGEESSESIISEIFAFVSHCVLPEYLQLPLQISKL